MVLASASCLTSKVWLCLTLVLCLQGTKSLRPMQLDVAVPDGRVICVNVDSASTSSEMCEMIASNINIKDSFGFSLHITVDQKVSYTKLHDTLLMAVFVHRA